MLIQSSDACMAISLQVNIVTCGGSLSDFEYMGLSYWSSYATNAAPERFFPCLCYRLCISGCGSCSDAVYGSK